MTKREMAMHSIIFGICTQAEIVPDLAGGWRFQLWYNLKGNQRCYQSKPHDERAGAERAGKRLFADAETLRKKLGK